MAICEYRDIAKWKNGDKKLGCFGRISVYKSIYGATLNICEGCFNRLIVKYPKMVKIWK